MCSVSVAFTTNVCCSYTVRNGTFSYEININGATGSKECEGAVVCQRDGTKAQSLADVKTVKYFIQGENICQSCCCV